MPVPDADYFDQWYDDMSRSPQRDALFARHLGLPEQFQSTSLLSYAGVQEIREVLDLQPGQVLLDLGCGRGGYGLWLARESGARVVGIDFSQVAVAQAREVAAALGPSPDSDFRVGSLVDCGLDDACVDAVICIDAIQFADDPAAAAAEIRRVLRAGGVAAVTCWEAREAGDDAVPERIRRVDLRRQLTASGLVDVEVEERPAWTALERGLWEDAASVDPAGEPALQSLRDEGERVLSTLDRTRRVLATGRAPG